jgi:hypothetical protein
MRVERSAYFTRLVPAAAVALACAAMAPASHAQGRPSTVTEQQLAEQAYAQQEAGHYAEAISTYLKAYEMSKDGLTLLNIATIYDKKLHEPALAAEYYRRYAMSPDAEPARVKKVTERVTALKREAEEAQQRSVAAPSASAPNPEPSTAPPPPSASIALPPPPVETASGLGPMRVTAIVVGGAGVVGVGTAMVLGYLAKMKNDDANKVCQGTACSSDAGVQSAKDAGKFATASTVTFIGGLALLASGITLFAVAPSGGAPAQAGRVLVVPAAGTTGGGLSVQGAF